MHWFGSGRVRYKLPCIVVSGCATDSDWASAQDLVSVA